MLLIKKQAHPVMTLYQATKACVKALRPILLDKQQINAK